MVPECASHNLALQIFIRHYNYFGKGCGVMSLEEASVIGRFFRFILGGNDFYRIHSFKHCEFPLSSLHFLHGHPFGCSFKWMRIRAGVGAVRVSLLAPLFSLLIVLLIFLGISVAAVRINANQPT